MRTVPARPFGENTFTLNPTPALLSEMDTPRSPMAIASGVRPSAVVPSGEQATFVVPVTHAKPVTVVEKKPAPVSVRLVSTVFALPPPPPPGVPQEHVVPLQVRKSPALHVGCAAPSPPFAATRVPDTSVPNATVAHVGAALPLSTRANWLVQVPTPLYVLASWAFVTVPLSCEVATCAHVRLPFAAIVVAY